jgi:hypothetical protein
MRLRLGRVRAATSLLLTIFDTLRQRTWWAYRGAALPPRAPRIAVVAQRAPDRATYVPRLTAAWRSLAAQALTVEATSLVIDRDGALLPVVWIDGRQRPDIADLPRVLQREPDPALLATQWLLDRAQDRVLLIVTLAEPVSHTWAIAFDLSRYTGVLQRIAQAGQLVVALQPSIAIDHMHAPSPDDLPPHLTIPLASAVQLHAILLSLASPA